MTSPRTVQSISFGALSQPRRWDHVGDPLARHGRRFVPHPGHGLVDRAASVAPAYL